MEHWPLECSCVKPEGVKEKERMRDTERGGKKKGERHQRPCSSQRPHADSSRSSSDRPPHEFPHQQRAALLIKVPQSYRRALKQRSAHTHLKSLNKADYLGPHPSAVFLYHPSPPAPRHTHTNVSLSLCWSFHFSLFNCSFGLSPLILTGMFKKLQEMLEKSTSNDF